MKNLKQRSHSKLNFYLKKTETFSQNNANILVLNADKCNKSVIMLKNYYENKLKNLLNDQLTYRKELKDLTSRVQDAVNKLVLKWQKSEMIDTNTKNYLSCYKGNAPYINGLPKLLKENIPLRPIIGKVGSPTYKLSNFCLTL